MSASDLEAELTGVVGSAHVLTDPDVRAPYEVDWTGRFRGRARCIVRPRTTVEVSAVLAACHTAGQQVQVQGGDTGLVGGSVPAGGEVVLSTRRLGALEDVDRAARTVVAGAGVTLAALQAHARAAGLAVGTDFASRDSATVGGLVATNAGGLRVVRHGDVRRQVRGVELVLADGTVVTRLAGLAKDATGYDLPGLACGSEGTLGVVTRVTWALAQPDPEGVVALVGCHGIAEALALLDCVRATHLPLLAAETFGAAELAVVRDHTGLAAPLGGEHRTHLVLEVAGEDVLDRLGEVLGHLPEGAVAVGTTRGERERLWAYRERITESIGALGVPVKLDVAVPLGALVAFLDGAPGAVRRVAPRARVLAFGHLAEGNLHVNVLGARDQNEEEAVEEAVLRLVAEHGGSISAEHGVGRAKVRWLHLTRSATDIAAMRALRSALDPDDQLNPGVLLS